MAVPAVPGCSQNSTDKEKGWNASNSAQPLITLNNTDKQEGTKPRSKSQSLAILFNPNDFLAAHHPAADYVARQFSMRSDRALLIARLHWGER